MPEENNNADKLLKAYAKKRRDEAGTPAPIHEATRRMLQAEVKRTFASTKAPAKSQRDFGWSPWAAIASVLAVAFVLSWIFKPGQTSERAPMKVAQAASSALPQDELRSVDNLTPAARSLEVADSRRAEPSALMSESIATSGAIYMTNGTTKSLDSTNLMTFSAAHLAKAEA